MAVPQLQQGGIGAMCRAQESCAGTGVGQRVRKLSLCGGVPSQAQRVKGRKKKHDRLVCCDVAPGLSIPLSCVDGENIKPACRRGILIEPIAVMAKVIRDERNKSGVVEVDLRNAALFLVKDHSHCIASCEQ